jgi:hypothetical protein
MKTTLLALAATAASLLTTAASAQVATVPNGTFDTWTTRTALEVPVSWTTVDEAIKSNPIFGSIYNTVTTSKDAASRSGAFAAKMESKTDFFVSLALGGPVPGGAVLGSVSAEDALVLITTRNINSAGGLPFTTRAASLQFYYKLTGTNALADSACALISLTRTVEGVVQTVASGGVRLNPASTYTLSTIPLLYTSSLAPDSVHIGFVSGLGKVRTVGTILTVDDVTMNGVVASTQSPALAAALTVYPNPSASGEFRLASPSRPAVATAPYNITDATGRVVRAATAAPASLAAGRPLELKGLPAGVYLLNLSTPEGPLTRKLMVE